jgi:hypothetical protein
VWRRIRSGRLETEREGRRLYVRLPGEYPLLERQPGGAAARGRSAEAAAVYIAAPFIPVPASELQPGPWPYTPERVARQREYALERQRRFLEKQREWFEEMDRLRGELKPWPPGYDFQRFIRELKDENRAWDGLLRGERAMRARARRTRR